jgi:hypothetical protein
VSRGSLAVPVFLPELLMVRLTGFEPVALSSGG